MRPVSASSASTPKTGPFPAPANVRWTNTKRGHTADEQPPRLRVMPRDRRAPDNLGLLIFDDFLHLVRRARARCRCRCRTRPALGRSPLADAPDRRRRIDVVRIFEALHQLQDVREGGGVDVAGAQVGGEVVDRHAEVDGVDVGEGLVGRVESHDADLVDEGAGHVVEAVETLDNTVRVVEAGRGADVACVGSASAVGEAAAADEGV